MIENGWRIRYDGYRVVVEVCLFRYGVGRWKQNIDRCDCSAILLPAHIPGFFSLQKENRDVRYRESFGYKTGW